MYDIVIVGAGPAGMTAALYAARGGRSVLMIEKLGYGGQIINTPEVENYPGIGKTSGYELAEKMYGQAIELGAELEYDEIVSVERTTAGFELTGESKKVYQARSVIFATGVTARHLGIDRENDLVGRGVSYCATCDGAFFKGRDVIVVGGGNTALEDAEYMSAIAPKVYLVHRRDAFRGDKVTSDRLEAKENVEFVLDSVSEKFIGAEKVEGLTVKNVKTGELRDIPASCVFVALGHVPSNGAFAELAGLDDAGFFDSGESCTTASAGVFVAGDARRKDRRQLVTAVSDGATAAMAAIDYLNSL